MKEEKIMVDVVMTVYNHEKFIKEALLGVLKQNTKFKVRVKLFDDCSTDSSPEIINLIIKENTSEIKIDYYRQPHNLGMMKNGIMAFESCTAKYIAICEGDDFWTDPLKLQTQVEFLEKNPGFSITYHRVNELNSNGKITLESLNKSTVEKTYTIEDLACGNIIHTPSLVFKNNIADFPIWFKDSPVGDYVISMLNAKNGDIKYFPQPMAVYRRHETSSWSSLNKDDALRKWLNVLLLLINYFEENINIKGILIQQFKNRFIDLRNAMVSGKKFDEYAFILSEFLKFDFFHKLWIEEIYPEELRKDTENYIGIRSAFLMFKREIRYKFKKT